MSLRRSPVARSGRARTTLTRGRGGDNAGRIAPEGFASLSLPHDTVVALLDELDLFASLDDDEIEALARKVDTVSWEAGTTIFEEGDPGDVGYVIHSGRVKVMRRLVDGQPIALAQLGHGGIVGELALLASAPPLGDAAGGRPTTAIAISREDLMAILHGNADAAISMAVHVAGLLQRTEDRRFASATSTVNGRILATLLAQVEARQQVATRRGGHRARREPERPRAARRGAEGRHRTRAALARERGLDPPQARPHHRPLAHGAEGHLG